MSNNASLGDAVNNLVDQISSAVTHNGPVAWTLLVNKAHIEGIFDVTVGGLGLVGFVTAAIIFGRNLLWICRNEAKSPAEQEHDEGPLALTIISGLSGFILLILTCAFLLDSSTWMRLVYPQGYVAAAIANDVLSHR